MSTASHFDLRPRHGLIERVVGMLRTHITNGTWPVGSRIPTEPELSKLTGVGRNTVREAVQSLVHTGLLERRQGSGTYVLADNEIVVHMSKYTAYDRERATASSEAFAALWIQACSLAAQRRTASQAEDLDEATIDLIGDPAYLVTSESDLGLHSNPVRIHPVVDVILQASASHMTADLAIGLLYGLFEHGPLTCDGQPLLACARAVCTGNREAAATAASQVVASLQLQPPPAPQPTPPGF